MEGVQIEHLTNNSGAIPNGNPLASRPGEAMEEAESAMNGQLEIEIPAADRQGAIHTIQLQSPGGNRHIVEGLVVTTAAGGSGGEDGETTTLFHPTQAGTFLMPATSNHHHNHLTSSTTSTMFTSASPSCDVITADFADHPILSGLQVGQVVTVTIGKDGEIIVHVPSSATGSDKHGEMQQVMVLQSAKKISEEPPPNEHRVEINSPSPKPVVTNLKHKNSVAQYVKSPTSTLKEDGRWKCDHCDASFKMKRTRDMHRDVIHFKLKYNVCHVCDKPFKWPSALAAHTKIHLDIRDYKCELCHIGFKTSSGLKAHQVVHQTARVFMCFVCGKGFKTKRAVNAHEKVHIKGAKAVGASQSNPTSTSSATAFLASPHQLQSATSTATMSSTTSPDPLLGVP